MFAEFEVLVYGHFHEDESDNGFKATRWVPWTEVERVENEEGEEAAPEEAFTMLGDLLESAKGMLLADTRE